MLEAIHIPPGETPEIPLFPGITVEIKLRHTQTADLFSSVEVAVAPKTMGPAPHLHQTLDEIMYVLEGEASVLVGDEVTVIETGGWHLRPTGFSTPSGMQRTNRCASLTSIPIRISKTFSLS